MPNPNEFDYMSCEARLTAKYLSITMGLSGSLDDEKNSSLKRVLADFKAIMIGDKSWIVKTDLSPSDVVNLIRRHLQGNDYVHVFTVSGALAWAGPFFACELFEQIGIVPDRCVEGPNPVDPSL